jgi:hypothetical protein
MHNTDLDSGLALCNMLLRLRFNSLSSACNCSLFVVKCFLPLLIQISKLCYVNFVWSSKARSWFSMIANHVTQNK